MDYSGIRIGPQTAADGSLVQTRGQREGAAVGSNLGGFYEEAAGRGQLFTMVLPATTTGVAAGNIVGAAAAASTQFALFNPLASGKNLVIIEFGMGIISGTPGAGPLFHGFFNSVPTLAASATILSDLLGSNIASVAKGYTSAAGAALTGGSAPTTHKLANFGSTATAQASPYMVSTIELVDGKIVIPPGSGWLPLWAAAGTSLLNGYSVTWREVTP